MTAQSNCTDKTKKITSNIQFNPKRIPKKYGCIIIS